VVHYSRLLSKWQDLITQKPTGKNAIKNSS